MTAQEPAMAMVNQMIPLNGQQNGSPSTWRSTSKAMDSSPAILSSERYKGIKLEFKEDKVSISANNPDLGEA